MLASPPSRQRRLLGLQARVLTERLVDDLIANPSSILLTLIFGLGFLFTYDGQLGSAPAIARGAGGDYLAFVVPTAVLVASFASATGAYLLVRDVEDRYVDRLLTMPLSRVAIVAAPMLVGAAYATIQAVVVLGLGAILGATPVTGLGGVAAILVLVAIWGTGIAGYLTAAALLARDVEIMRLVDLCFFAFLFFLSPILLPRDDLAGWLQPLTDINPASYVLEGIRALMLEGWQLSAIWPALAAGIGFTTLSLLAAVLVSRRRLAG